jgi:hypothetical protein
MGLGFVTVFDRAWDLVKTSPHYEMQINILRKLNADNYSLLCLINRSDLFAREDGDMRQFFDYIKMASASTANEFARQLTEWWDNPDAMVELNLNDELEGME